MNLVIIQHEKLFSRGLKYLIGQSVSLQIHELANADAVESQLVSLNPNVALIDVDLPSCCPFKLAERISAMVPMCKIVFLGRSATNLLVSNVLQAKADGFLLKSDSQETIVEALHKVLAGEVFYTSSMMNMIVFDPHLRAYRMASDGQGPLLTNRQIEVLRYLAWGHSVKQIAKIMHLSEKSVDSHKYRIMNRLGIHDRVKLALFAIREQLIDPWAAEEIS
jgi:DNA-binding NarL/FixJ family response regulator